MEIAPIEEHHHHCPGEPDMTERRYGKIWRDEWNKSNAENKARKNSLIWASSPKRALPAVGETANIEWNGAVISTSCRRKWLRNFSAPVLLMLAYNHKCLYRFTILIERKYGEETKT